MILIGDGIHNLLGGMAVGTLFMSDSKTGWALFTASIAHEVPQEIGDLASMVF
ncbi:zinc/iron permease, partial [Kipferlia bialata]|eukprot:g15876.t1